MKIIPVHVECSVRLIFIDTKHTHEAIHSKVLSRGSRRRTLFIVAMYVFTLRRLQKDSWRSRHAFEMMANGRPVGRHNNVQASNSPANDSACKRWSSCGRHDETHAMDFLADQHRSPGYSSSGRPGSRAECFDCIEKHCHRMSHRWRRRRRRQRCQATWALLRHRRSLLRSRQTLGWTARDIRKAEHAVSIGDDRHRSSDFKVALKALCYGKDALHSLPPFCGCTHCCFYLGDYALQ